MTTFDQYHLSAFRQLLALQGETVTYTPRGGSPRSIKALVKRFIPGATEQSPDHGNRIRIEIKILNDDIEGVTSIDTRGDIVTLPRVTGGDPDQFPVTIVLNDSAARWHLRLR